MGQIRLDVVTKIEDFYTSKKKFRPENERHVEPLVPTKAALFGLDLRFRDVEKIMAAKSVIKANDPNSPTHINRHLAPSEAVVQSERYTKRRRAHFSQGTCFDQVITERLNVSLPHNISYLTYKDLEPMKQLTSAEKQKKKEKYLSSLNRSANEQTYIELERQLKCQMAESDTKPKDTDTTMDRPSVRRGRIFKTFEEVEYVQNLVKQTADYQEQQLIKKQLATVDYQPMDFQDSTMFNTDVNSIVREISNSWTVKTIVKPPQPAKQLKPLQQHTQRQQQQPANMSKTNGTQWSLAFNKQQPQPEGLSNEDLTVRSNQLKQLKQMEAEATKVFNSNRNWSIMIKSQDNEIRNEIMRRTRSNQIRRRLNQINEISSKPPNTAVVAKRETTEQDQQEWKDQFTEYLRDLVTKSSSTAPSQPQQSKALDKRVRQALLNKIQRGVDAFGNKTDISIKDISAFIETELHMGWQTGA